MTGARVFLEDRARAFVSENARDLASGVGSADPSSSR
jgi:hypothetical protein